MDIRNVLHSLQERYIYTSTVALTRESVQHLILSGNVRRIKTIFSFALEYCLLRVKGILVLKKNIWKT